MPLQRVITDFAADESFERASRKITEHYKIYVPASSIRKIALAHAQQMESEKEEIQAINTTQPIANYIIAEADGTMAPIVVNAKDADKRKNKTLQWREARVSLAFKKGNIKPFYDASFGTPEEIGDQIAYCVRSAGMNSHTKIHFIGDGASWIAEQVERSFGSDAYYLIDYYHLSEYLNAAAQCCAPVAPREWRVSMQLFMKDGKLSSVLKALQDHIIATKSDDHECSAKKCYNYMEKRLHQFDYQGAIAKDLPIGSGRVESAHRTIIQKRLKVPGAWWLEKNAQSMLAMRAIRENGFWENY